MIETISTFRICYAYINTKYFENVLGFVSFECILLLKLRTMIQQYRRVLYRDYDIYLFCETVQI